MSLVPEPEAPMEVSDNEIHTDGIYDTDMDTEFHTMDADLDDNEIENMDTIQPDRPEVMEPEDGNGNDDDSQDYQMKEGNDEEEGHVHMATDSMFDELDDLDPVDIKNDLVEEMGGHGTSPESQYVDELDVDDHQSNEVQGELEPEQPREQALELDFDQEQLREIEFEEKQAPEPVLEEESELELEQESEYDELGHVQDHQGADEHPLEQEEASEPELERTKEKDSGDENQIQDEQNPLSSPHSPSIPNEEEKQNTAESNILPVLSEEKGPSFTDDEQGILDLHGHSENEQQQEYVEKVISTDKLGNALENDGNTDIEHANADQETPEHNDTKPVEIGRQTDIFKEVEDTSALGVQYENEPIKDGASEDENAETEPAAQDEHGPITVVDLSSESDSYQEPGVEQTTEEDQATILESEPQQPSILTTFRICVKFQDLQFFLYPLTEEDAAQSDIFLMDAVPSGDISIEYLCATMREAIASKGDVEISLNDELKLHFTQLQLAIGEDNLYSRDLTIQDVAELYAGLAANTPEESRPSELEVEVTTKERFFHSFTIMHGLMEDGGGFQDLTGQEFDAVAAYEESETEEHEEHEKPEVGNEVESQAEDIAKLTDFEGAKVIDDGHDHDDGEGEGEGEEQKQLEKEGEQQKDNKPETIPELARQVAEASEGKNHELDLELDSAVKRARDEEDEDKDAPNVKRKVELAQDSTE